MNEEERRKTEGTVGYLLDQLQKTDLGKDNNPLRAVACLFTLKSTLEKWLTPRLAFWCLECDARAALTSVLSRGVKPHDGQDEALVHSLAMETLWLLSGVGRNTVDAMLTWSGLFDTLSQYLDVSGGFYHFGPGVQRHLRDLRRRGPFPQQRVTAVPLSDKTWSDLLRYMPSLRAWGGIRPSHLYRCHLSCPREGETQEPSIAARLVGQGLAWTLAEDRSTGPSPLVTTVEDLTHPSCDRTAGSSPPSDHHDDDDAQSVDSSRQDVRVVDAVGGHYFWAHIGGQAADMVKNIAEALSAAWPKLRTCRPGVGDVVAVLGKRSGGVDEPVAMRGKVLEVSKDEVTVFAVDYGKVERVRVCDVYRLPEPLGQLSCLAGQAKLCCLAGVRAPPVSVSAVEFALATLTNLTQCCSAAGVKLVDLGVMDHLDLLLTCGLPNLRLQTTRLLCNISPIPEISAAVDWSRFIRPLLGSLVELSRRQCLHQELDNLQRNLVVVTLFALANLLHQKPANHQLLFDLQGHFIVLNVLRLFRPHQMVRQAAIGVLKVIYPGMVHTPDHHESGRANETAKREEERTSSERRRAVDGGGNNGKKKGIEKSAEKQPDSSLIGASSSAASSCDVSGQTPELDKAVGLVPVDGASVLGEKNRFYVYDTCCPYQDDQTHHLLHVGSIRAVGFETVLEIILGMLNSAGGTIFIGLTKKGRVQGVRLDREDRDCVRLGVDEMMLKTLPSIPFNQLQVDYLPVMRKTWDGKLEPNGNTFVIEIHVKTPEELQFYVHRGVCHHRVGVVNHALSEQEVRELAIGQEEMKYLPHLESLRRQVLQLQD